MNHDLLDEQYGRFREIPLALARRGHAVRGVCLSYEPKGPERRLDHDHRSSAEVLWASVDLGRTVLPGIGSFVRGVRREMSDFEPHVIWAGSDSVYGIVGCLVRIGTTTPIVFDVYDDFENFTSAKIPGMTQAFRHLCRTADGVTTFSQPITTYISQTVGRAHNPTLTLPNGVDQSMFWKRDKGEARARLGLPLDAELVGFAGSISRNLGIDVVFQAHRLLLQTHPELHLVLAGPKKSGAEVWDGERIHDLGVLKQEDVPWLLSALDVGIALQRVGHAGRFGFPYKIAEMSACGLPYVAANLGALPRHIATCPECLFDPSSGKDLARAIRYQLRESHHGPRPPDWDEVAAMLEDFLVALA